MTRVRSGRVPQAESSWDISAKTIRKYFYSTGFLNWQLFFILLESTCPAGGDRGGALEAF